MDCSAIVLNKLLTERNLDIWSKVKLVFIDPAYASVYSSISRYYDKYGAIPSFEELELTIREGLGQKTLATLKLIDEPDISAEVALDALIDQYTQNHAINLLDKFLDKLPIYDSEEVKENLAAIVLDIDSKTLTTEGVYDMSNIMLFQTPESISKERVHLGINNTFDSVLGGVARQELILIGGTRGSGKSITCSNIVTNQYENGKTSVIFSIEMIGREVNERNYSILAEVPNLALKKGELTTDELFRVVKVRANMFLEADDLVTDFLTHRDRFKFEHDLVRNKVLKPNNQIIIIDDRALTLSSIDLHLGKLKAKFGESLTVCVVDYLNQIVVEGNKSQFEWMPQVDVSKKLKELARKHEVVMVSPYQIDAGGEARFAKGILDAADIALIMKAHEDSMSFKTTKIRGGPQLTFASPINWETLRTSPVNVELPTTDTTKKEKVKKADKDADLPWDA